MTVFKSRFMAVECKEETSALDYLARQVAQPKFVGAELLNTDLL